jgi:hypothetical protein
MKMAMPITRADQRAWYELSFDARRASLILRVHRDFIGNLEYKATNESPIVKGFKQQFGFEQFDGSLERDFGFERIFRMKQFCPDGHNEFICKLPQVKKETDETCKECGGTGKDRRTHDHRCLGCRGTGKIWKMDWLKVYAISSSFTVFSNLASRPPWGDAPPPVKATDRLQLLTVQTVTLQGMHGGSLDGMLSIGLARWLRRFPAGTRLGSIEAVMRLAYGRMLGYRKYDRHDFRVWLQDDKGRLVLDCPGKNNCCIHPDGWPSSDTPRGYDFTCHNVDTPMQQLTLIAGLAALCDLARAELDK